MDLEKAEEPDIKLPASIVSYKNQGNSKKKRERKIYFCFTDYIKDFVWMITNCGKFLRRWEYQITLPVFRETCMQNKRQQNLVWNNRLVHNWERSMSRLYIVTVYYTLYIMRNGRLDDS